MAPILLAPRLRSLDVQTDSESTGMTQQSPPPPDSKSTGDLPSTSVPVSSMSSSMSLFSIFMPSWRPTSPSETVADQDSNHPRDKTVENSPTREASTPSPMASQMSPQSNAPVSLEGTLFFRNSRAAPGSSGWKHIYVVLNLTDGGSIACYKPRRGSSAKNNSKSKKNKNSRRETTFWTNEHLTHDDMVPRLHLPGHVNWVAKDIKNNSTAFVIEVASEEPLLPFGSMTSNEFVSVVNRMPVEISELPNKAVASDRMALPAELEDDILRCKERGCPFRVYFKCSRSGNEKVLWLRAFEQMNRLSYELHSPKGVMATFSKANLQISHSRMRSHLAQRFAIEGRALDDQPVGSALEDPGRNLRDRRKGIGSDEKEHLVYPLYAYPNRWMTDSELYQQMLKPSETFHDLRLNNCKQKEIGVLKVEILQCVGLPALDFASETDAVCYFVCGSYAFTTDVIWNRLNPMWLPRSRRACTIPLHHAYARLFVGLFDDDGKGEKDDFAGRVVLDLARCRPRSTYDVTLPLRLSAHVYSRRARGAIRLRFSVEWHSERDALLSYIPKGIRAPTTARPDDDVTVLCADEKAFRNIVTTVHGIHMPGRFSFSQWRATMREANFARKLVINTVRKVVFDIIKWENPALSGLIFCAWMHCIYRNAFNLVPFYGMLFLLLMMMRTYVMYGSDGPNQNGFIPPSYEEMAYALVKSGGCKVIEPLKIKPMRPTRRATYKSERMLTEAKPKTHNQKGKWLFRLLGFKSTLEDALPEDYHMEFPFSQGLNYPKFTVKECLVPKTSLLSGKKKSYEDDGDQILGDLMAPSIPWRVKEKKMSMDLLSKGKHKAEDDRRNSYPPRMERSHGFVGGGSTPPSMVINKVERGKSETSVVASEDLPPHLRIPEQNIDAKGPARKKKLGDELAEVQYNMHKMTFHLFHDRTHVVRHPEAVYFGQANKSEWRKAHNVENDLDRLLNVGQYSSANPVVARVGLYVEPIISAAHSFILLSRAVYNIVTWRDPMLSFWVSLFLAASVVFFAIFPWRLFLFVTGFLVVGPQNWMLRIMDERGVSAFIKKFLEKRRKKQKKSDKKEDGGLDRKLPENQAIVSSHTSDNSPPLSLSRKDVDPREIHQVSVPYSQLMYQRFYDWPPEAQYSKCEPTAELSYLNGCGSRSRHGSNHSVNIPRRHGTSTEEL